MSIKVYENSKRVAEKIQSIREINYWSYYTPKMEAGPCTTVEHMLRIVKPDVFEPLPMNKINKKICPEDPQVWWVVTTTPVCFGWRNGKCNNIKITKNGVYNNCKFIHDHSPYIKVEMVNTDTLLKKMNNRTKKLRENGTKMNKTHYLNPFTGIWYPCNYKKQNFNRDTRQQYIENKKQLVNDINNHSTHHFSNLTPFVTNWVIQQRGELNLLRSREEKAGLI